MINKAGMRRSQVSSLALPSVSCWRKLRRHAKPQSHASDATFGHHFFAVAEGQGESRLADDLE